MFESAGPVAFLAVNDAFRALLREFPRSVARLAGDLARNTSASVAVSAINVPVDLVLPGIVPLTTTLGAFSPVFHGTKTKAELRERRAVRGTVGRVDSSRLTGGSISACFGEYSPDIFLEAHE